MSVVESPPTDLQNVRISTNSLNVNGSASFTSASVAGSFSAGNTSLTSATVSGTLSAGASTLASANISGTLSAGSINVSGTLAAGASTISSVNVTGTLSAGDTTVASLMTGSLSAGPSTCHLMGLNNGSAMLPSYTFTSSPSTGMYLSNLNEIGLSSSGVERLRVSDTHITALEPIQLSNTEGANPSLTFQSDTDTGLRWNSDNDMTFMTGGLNKLQVSSEHVSCYDAPFYIYSNVAGQGQKIRFYGYNYSNPQIATDISQQCTEGNKALEFSPVTSGLNVTDIIYRFKSGGSNEIQVNQRGQLILSAGAVSTPSLCFSTSTNSGLYWDTGSIRISLSSTERLRISSSGIRIGANGTDMSMIRSGKANMLNPNIGAGGNTWDLGPFAFGATFPSVPTVTISVRPYNSGTGMAWLDHCIVGLSSVTVSEFRIYIVNKGSGQTQGSFEINWIAMI